MSTLSITNTFVANTLAQAAQVNQNFADVVTWANGNISNNNILGAANIALSKLDKTAQFLVLMATGNLTIGSGRTGDTQPRVTQTSDGELKFGVGSATAPDTMFARTAAQVVALTDTAGTVFGTLHLGGLKLQSSTSIATVGINTNYAGSKTIGINTKNASSTEAIIPVLSTDKEIHGFFINRNNTAGAYILAQPAGLGGVAWGDRLVLSGNYNSLGDYTEPSFLNGTLFSPGGRLCLTTGLPVGDGSATYGLYYTPFYHNQIALPDTDGNIWIGEFTELTVTVNPAFTTASLPYDIFISLSSSTPTLSYTAWSSTTTRLTNLVYHSNGYWYPNGNKAKLYLGTVHLDGSKQMNDIPSQRCVYNFYNRVPKSLYAEDTTASWTYNTATWRAANGSSTVGVARTEFVLGFADTMVKASYHATYTNTAAASNSVAGIALDSTTVPYASAAVHNGQAALRQHTVVDYQGFPAVGYHYIQNMEIRDTNSATNTWYGTHPTTATQEAKQVGWLYI
jgi:hypothetical protein